MGSIRISFAYSKVNQIEYRLNVLIRIFSRIAEFYQTQKRLTIDAINKHLKGNKSSLIPMKNIIIIKHCLDMVTFTEPTAGMFVWLKIRGISDTKKLIYEKALAQEVLFIPGNAFFVDQNKSYPFVRVSYSLCTPEQIETVISFIKLYSRFID